MSRLVRLNLTDGRQIAINPDHVAWVTPEHGESGATHIALPGRSVTVQEDYKTVLGMIHAGRS